jgi:DNA-binding IclR family transcriptional regulator
MALTITVKGIVLADMLIRDERVLAWLRERSSGQPTQVKYQDIADHFGCHWLTARNIMHRLEGARLISVDKRAKRGGYVYRVVS